MTLQDFDPETAVQYWHKAVKRLHVAEQLLGLGHIEDAANRGHYAVFSVISLLHYLTGMSYSSHQQVLGMFNKNFVHCRTFSRKAGKTATDLFYLRQKADYDFVQDIDEDLTRKCIEEAADLFAEAAEYLSYYSPELSKAINSDTQP